MHLSDPGGHFVGGGGAAGDQLRAARVGAGPLRQAALPQEILVVAPQFLQARPADVRQFQFHLLRRSGGLASLGDVLNSGARGLCHLVVSAALAVNITVAETDRHIVDQLRNLKAFQLAIAAVFGDERLRTGDHARLPLMKVDDMDFMDAGRLLAGHRRKATCA